MRRYASIGAALTTVGIIAISVSVPRAAAPVDDQTIVHVLNRLGFGPRRGDVDRVRAMGLQKYIEQQLHPDRLRDADLGARLAGLTTLTMSSKEIAEKFEEPQLEARRQAKQDAAQSGD